jgi:RNA polymerase sigma-70 factor, ECF subfamily
MRRLFTFEQRAISGRVTIASLGHVSCAGASATFSYSGASHSPCATLVPQKRESLTQHLMLTCHNVLPGSKLTAPSNEHPRKKKAILIAGMTEAEAIERAQSGDAVSFEALYNQHKRRVFSLCLRMTGNYARAEDLTQEAFLQLYRKIKSFRGESQFSTWLHRLSVNIVLMHLRKQKSTDVSLEETLEPQSEDGPTRDIGITDLVLCGSVDRITLEHAIASLPPGYRMIFILHDIEGYEHNEIAEILSCSIGNSKSQLHKARTKLRLFLHPNIRTVFTPAVADQSEDQLAA